MTGLVLALQNVCFFLLKLSDFVSCLRLFDSLFPEADELDASAMEHISSLLLSSTSENSDANAVDVTENGDGSNDDCPKETEMKKKVSLAITLQRLEAMARDPYRRFLLFSPNELFGIERREECDDDDDEDEDENCTFDDETGNLRTDEEVVGAKTEALIERNGEETEEQNEVFDNTGYVEGTFIKNPLTANFPFLASSNLVCAGPFGSLIVCLRSSSSPFMPHLNARWLAR